MAFVSIANEGERYVEFRRWWLGEEMPRFLFVKLPWEKKPFYLDVDSIIYSRIFMNEVRRHADLAGSLKGTITLSEMLPAHAEHWIEDAEKNLYAGELRLVAIRAEDSARASR